MCLHYGQTLNNGACIFLAPAVQSKNISGAGRTGLINSFGFLLPPPSPLNGENLTGKSAYNKYLNFPLKKWKSGRFYAILFV
jgi:hypothetical protein